MFLLDYFDFCIKINQCRANNGICHLKFIHPLWKIQHKCPTEGLLIPNGLAGSTLSHEMLSSSVIDLRKKKVFFFFLFLFFVLVWEGEVTVWKRSHWLISIFAKWRWGKRVLINSGYWEKLSVNTEVIKTSQTGLHPVSLFGWISRGGGSPGDPPSGYCNPR